MNSGEEKMKNAIIASRGWGLVSNALQNFCLWCICLFLPVAVSCKLERLSTGPMIEKESTKSNVTDKAEQKKFAVPDPVPPEGPALQGMQLALLEMDSPNRIAEKLPLSLVSRKRITKGLVNAFFGFVGIKDVTRVVDLSRTFVMTFVTPAAEFSFGNLVEMAGRGNIDFSRYLPVFVARVPVKGNGSDFLIRLGEIAEESMSTAWGGHFFKIGTKGVWVHIRGSWAVLAQREEHVGPAWKLFDGRKLRIREGGLRLDFFVERFHGFISATQSFVRMIQSSGVKAKSGDMKIVNALSMVLGVMSETGQVSVELNVDDKEGIEFTLTGGGLRGSMGTWLRELKSPDTTLYGVMDAGTPVRAVSTVLKTERYFWTDVACVAWQAMLQKPDGLTLEKREELRSGMRTLLDGWAESLGTSRLISFYFEDNGGPAFLLVFSLDNPERFTKTAAMAAEFAQSELMPLQKLMIDERGDRELRKKAGAKKGFGYKISRSTRLLRGARVQQVAIRPARGVNKNSERVSFREFFFPKGFVVSALTHDGFAVIHIGESQKSLPNILDRLKKRKKTLKANAKESLRDVFKELPVEDMASVAVVDGASLLGGLSSFFAKRAPNVLKRMKPAAREEVKNVEPQRSRKRRSGFTYESLKKMSGYMESLRPLTAAKKSKPLKHPVLYMGGRSENDYVMKIKIPTHDLKKLFAPLDYSKTGR